MEKKLTPEQYRILREKGTEAPFTGKLLHEKTVFIIALIAVILYFLQIPNLTLEPAGQVLASLYQNL